MQDLITDLGGLELLLAATQFDPDAAIVREWALWAVKGLCDGNARVQARIAELKLDGVVVDEAMARSGVRVELDKATGKLTMKSGDASGSQSGHSAGVTEQR